LLYAHVGEPYCPETGVRIVTQSTSDIVDKVLGLPPRSRVMVLAPVVRVQKGEFRDVVERLAREGFVRARVDGQMVELANGVRIKLDPKQKHTIEAVVDRLVIDEKIRVRLADSIETALRWGQGVILTLHQPPGDESKVQSLKAKVLNPQSTVHGPESKVQGSIATPILLRSTTPVSEWIETLHSNRNFSPATGKSYEPLTPKHFSFNAPAGACPVCHGLGQKMVFDEGLVVPDPEKSLEQGAILPWRRGGKRMAAYYKGLLRGVAAHYRQSMDTPYKSLPEDFKRVLLHGSGDTEIQFTFWRAGTPSKVSRPFEGVIPNLQRLYQESESEFTRNRLKAFMSPQFCDACNGQRLKPEILAVRLESRAGVPPAPPSTPGVPPALPSTPGVPPAPQSTAGIPPLSGPGVGIQGGRRDALPYFTGPFYHGPLLPLCGQSRRLSRGTQAHRFSTENRR